jgi:hypothetical protein
MIPTAEEFWSDVISSENKYSMLSLLRKSGLAKHVFEAMRRFARVHVEEALKEASEKARYMRIGTNVSINESSILNAYPPENIK